MSFTAPLSGTRNLVEKTGYLSAPLPALSCRLLRQKDSPELHKFLQLLVHPVLLAREVAFIGSTSTEVSARDRNTEKHSGPARSSDGERGRPPPGGPAPVSLGLRVRPPTPARLAASVKCPTRCPGHRGDRRVTGPRRRKRQGRTAAPLPGRLATAQREAMATSGREQEARNYLEKHRIMELLNYLTSNLLFSQPGKGLGCHLAFCPTCLPTPNGSSEIPRTAFPPRRRPSGSRIQIPHLHLHTHSLLLFCCLSLSAAN